MNKLVTFESSNPEIIRINEAGKVTARSPGKATIRAIASDTIYAECEIIVEEGPIIYIPQNIQVIYEEAFSDSGIEYVVIPNGCTEIKSRAFANCNELRIVVIPSSVKAISDDAFSGSTNVTIIAPQSSYAEEFAIANGIECE